VFAARAETRHNASVKTSLDCYPCFLRNVLNAARLSGADEDTQKRIVAESLDVLREQPPAGRTPPELMSQMLALTALRTGVADPYAAAKRECNRQARLWLPALERSLAASADPVALALRISVIGNVMDLGAFESFDIGSLLEKAEHHILKGNAEAGLRARLEQGGDLVCIADNAGEVFFDMLLLKTLAAQYRLGKVRLLLRDKPFLNDTCLCEAEEAGLAGTAQGVELGQLPLSSPDGGLPDFGTATVIAKGMANYERFSEHESMFFLFMVKCAPVGQYASRQSGSDIGNGDWVLITNERSENRASVPCP
jgi:hypothetical protein